MWTCEAVQAGSVCGAPATKLASTPWTRTLVCDLCAQSFHRYVLKSLSEFDESVDPKTFPLQPDEQPPRYAQTQDADGVAHVWCFCGKEGRWRATKRGRQIGLCDAHGEEYAELLQGAHNTTPIRDALLDIARELVKMMRQFTRKGNHQNAPQPLRDVHRSGLQRRRGHRR